MRLAGRVLLLLLPALVLVCAATVGGQKPAPPDAEGRVEELLSRMTLDEKLSLLAGTGFDTVPIPRLGIPALHMTDGPAGVRTGRATSFPAGVALAASFDPALVERVGAAIAREAKAQGKNVLLAPCVNIQRAPHAGRNFESFGEDPFLAARIAVGYTRGVQSEGVMASVKHYAANNQERERHTIDVRVDERTLHELYFPAFKAAVQEGGAWSVMAAYNQVNGAFASENNYLLNEVLKKRWGFRGLVMSDWGAVKSTVPTLRGGLDLEMPTGVFLNPSEVKKALASGAVTQGELDDKVRRTLRAMLSLGLLEREVPAGGASDTPEHRRLTREAAREGVVLLKNEHALLPFDANRIRSVAVIGPNAAVARLGGGGSAQVVPPYSVSPLEGIKRRVGEKIRVEYAPGVVALEDTDAVPAENLRTPDGKSNGLQGEYFANMKLAGEPALRRVDAQVDFRWATGSPAPGLPADQFSTRWTGSLVAPVGGRYSLSLSSNDGGRLYLDDRLVVDLWADHATMTGTTVVELKAGEPRRLRIEHYESVGHADVRLGWRRIEEGTLRAAVEAARRADVAVVFAGLSEATETEALDRPDLNLPEGQDELIAAVARANPHTVVVLNSGGPLIPRGWLESVPALVQAFYLGQEGGGALAEILFGDASPSGRLPASWPRRWEDSHAFGRYPGRDGSVSYDEGLLVGYRWFDAKRIAPLYPFGHGLSYTRFEYSGLKLTQGHGDDPLVTVEFEVRNTGRRDGAEVVQIYVRDEASSLPRPLKELKGFRRIFLKAGEMQRVSLRLSAGAFSFYDPARGGWVLEAGDFDIMVGASSRDIRLQRRVRLAQTSTAHP
ncbi:MAG: glycoside hydrolase family 3 C-terminal domain-containing protein [Pyrinomonadaceae bacterium]